MLRSAGFGDAQEIDLTEEFLVTTRAWHTARARHEKQLRLEWGDELFEERQADSVAQMKAIEGGLLRRALFVAW